MINLNTRTVHEIRKLIAVQPLMQITTSRMNFKTRITYKGVVEYAQSLLVATLINKYISLRIEKKNEDSLLYLQKNKKKKIGAEKGIGGCL